MSKKVGNTPLLSSSFPTRSLVSLCHGFEGIIYCLVSQSMELAAEIYFYYFGSSVPNVPSLSEMDKDSALLACINLLFF